MNEYHRADMMIWQGRVDSEVDYNSFRWHQVMQQLNLDVEIEKAPKPLSFVLIGYKIDEGIRLNKGRIGAAQGPNKVREFLCNRPCSFSREVILYDGGNVSLVTTVEAAQTTLAALVRQCLEKNYFPIVIGGGHDVAYGTLKGVIDYVPLNEKRLGSINFDAHFDMRAADYSTSGTMFYQTYHDLKAKGYPFNHLTVGVQKSSNTVSLFNFANSINSDYILAGDFIYENKHELQTKMDAFVEQQDYIYITVCSDVFASPYAPGVSSPTPLGIMPELFLEELKHILTTKKVVAFDIAEISPALDSSNATATLGSLIIYTIVNHLAELHELTTI